MLATITRKLKNAYTMWKLVGTWTVIHLSFYKLLSQHITPPDVLINILKKKRLHTLKRILLQYPNTTIIIMLSDFHTWNIPLFQRPQHIGMNLAQQGFLYFFCIDSIANPFQEVSPRCFTTDHMGVLALKELNRKKIIHVYAHAPHYTLDYIRSNDDNIILCEYIDELNASINRTYQDAKLLDMARMRNKYMFEDQNIIMISTASKLHQEVLQYRSQNTALVTNGVDDKHFTITRDNNKVPEKIQMAVKSGKPIIGYFGALAKWFDYELVVKLAKSRPQYEIILIGFDYDQSMKKYILTQHQNITFTGVVDYKNLPSYACWFDVSIIPFLLNDVTEATSPIKLFEYMALGHPIVTTDMPECRKYKSVLIGKTHDEFITLIDQAINKKSDPTYLETLREDAMNNTWASKAKVIADMIKQHEKYPELISDQQCKQ